MELTRQEEERLGNIIGLPRVNKQIKEFVGPNEEMFGRLAHYTTADCALEIIKSRTLWLRNARSMRDYAEVQLGYQTIVPYFQSVNPKAKLVRALESVNQNLVNDVLEIIRTSYAAVYLYSFIACFTRHDADTENQDGRLSMWLNVRGEHPGAAIVIRSPKPYAVRPLRVVLRPVVYGSSVIDLIPEFDQVAQNIESEIQFLRDMDQQLLARHVAVNLHALAATLKSNSFKEESEWRVCHFPYLIHSEYVPWDTKSVRQVPQVIFKLPLENKPEVDINGIGLPDIIDKVIIGPSQHQDAIIHSFVMELDKAGVSDARSKVIGSKLTLR